MNLSQFLRLTGAGLAVGLALTLAAPASAKVLARVNGAEITDEDVKIAMEDIGSSLPQQIEGPARQAYILDYLIDAKLVAQKAEADKMGEGPEFAKKVAYYRDKVLMEDLLGKVAKDAATDTAIQKTYDDVAKQQKPEEEVRARHILVESEPDAQAALKRVKGGEDFAKVANEMSKDPGSKGGELGWFTKERMVPEFAEAAFKMQPGQISDPVKWQFGWHIIQLEERRQKQFPSLDQVRDQVTRYVVQKSQSELILKLREEAKVDRTEPEKPADAAPAPRTGVEGSGQSLRACILLEIGALDAGLARPQSEAKVTAHACAPSAFLPPEERRWPVPLRSLRSRPNPPPTCRGSRACASRRRGGHPLQGAHRRAAAAVRRRARGGGGLHEIAMPVRARSTGAAPSSRAARRGRWSSIPATPTPSPASAASTRSARRDSPRRRRGCEADEMFLASTGVIGEPLDAGKFDARARDGSRARPPGSLARRRARDHDDRHFSEGRERDGRRSAASGDASAASPRAPA